MPNCDKCFGKGTLVDPVLLRVELCVECRGTGERPAAPVIRDWSEFFGMPEDDTAHTEKKEPAHAE